MRNPRPSLEGLRSGVTSLLVGSLAANTRLAYNTACCKYEEFRKTYSIPLAWPITPSNLVLFLAYCFESVLAASTIRLYISGISFIHKIHS